VNSSSKAAPSGAVFIFVVPAKAGATLNVALARVAPDISAINDGDIS
jgi:hypothetical protein